MPTTTRALIAAALLLVLSTTAAPGQTSPHPISTNLSWDHCAGDGYIGDRAFDCSVNTGTEVFFVSIVLHDKTRHGVRAISAILDFTPTSASTPDWWQVGFGMCRQNGLAATAEIVEESASCLPWYWEAVPSPSTLFQTYYPEPGRLFARVAAVLTGAELPTATLLVDQEYVVFKFRLSHAKTTGAGSCSGCAVPACIGLSGLNLEYGFSVPDDQFAATGLNTLTWQSAYVAAYPTRPGSTSNLEHTNRLDCTLSPVPTHGRTWGMIKSMYR